ncbi:hypothetical protein [Tateyamaria sp. Alg231-49]|uniref:hypothetical protein n=1 Tax=Tateyamaria sp. Alg231-49 TaxID=1922219 RepID=UPI000D54AFA0|nr:hypothetical protein [Tateyamaria sp. Alg231-49]
MSKEPTTIQKPPRRHPKINKSGERDFTADVPTDWQIQDLMGMRTHDAASGVYNTAIMALGEQAERHANLASAMFAETEPQDAIEAMLVAQMTATHVAMTTLCERMTYQTNYQVREACERSMTRLSRTYLAQMNALKKYRSKAQQTVRVERVNVESGGQAIVGDVSHGGRVGGDGS